MLRDIRYVLNHRAPDPRLLLMHLDKAIYMWYAYQIDLAANGVGATTIAPNRRGSAAGGSLAFDEFCHYILVPNLQSWNGATSVGRDGILFDVEQIADELFQSRYPGRFDRSVLVPSAGSLVSDMFDTATDAVQEIRREYGDGPFETLIDRAQYSLTRTIAMRIRANAEPWLNYLRVRIHADRGWVGIPYTL